MGYPVSDLEQRIKRLLSADAERYRRLWEYYRNPMWVCGVRSDAKDLERPYRQAQEWGLPARITGFPAGNATAGAQLVAGLSRKEVVIENDIGWRVDTQVDYLFGKPLVIESAAPDPERRKVIGSLLRLILSHNGGVTFLQQLGLLGSVYGFVDVLVKMEESGAGEGSARLGKGGMQELGQPPAPEGGAAGSEPAPSVDQLSNPAAADRPHDGLPLEHLGRLIRLEVVEPARALPLLSREDCRVVEGYVQCYTIEQPAETPRRSEAKRNWIERMLGLASRRRAWEPPAGKMVVAEILSAQRWQRFEDGELVAEGDNSLGEVPLVHIQNTAVPFAYAGCSDVEPLIPLQDELNTRLSDRAYRLAMQSSRMYLGKGIEDFNNMPVTPGRMWQTENADAEVIEFGGSAACPPENDHLSDLREAMDKASAVTPVAAGAIKDRIGRLTSAAALRITLLSLLSKTEKKRTTYGAGIARMCELALAWLDAAGLFATAPEERRVELHWPSPLPQNDLELLQQARIKLEVGVAAEQVLRELGY